MISGVTNSLKSILVLLKDILVGGVSCIYILHERKKFAVQGKMLVYSILKEMGGQGYGRNQVYR